MRLSTRHGAVGYDEAGAGVPLLWLHGYPLDRALWAPQLADPPRGFRAIAPDLPGFGDSDRIAGRHLDHWADWTAGFMDALGVERAVVGGLSMGGYLAFALWRRHPARIRGLVLADTRADQDSEAVRARRHEMHALLLREGPGAIAERLIQGMVGRTTRRTRPDAVAALDAMMRRASVGAISDARECLLTRDDSTPTLAGITVPTLVLCGTEDILTPAALARDLHAAIPGSRLALVPEAGHASNFEQPAVFNRLLSEFLAATIPAGSP